MGKKLNLTMIIISVLLFLAYLGYVLIASFTQYDVFDTMIGLTIIFIAYWPLIIAAIITSTLSYKKNSKNLKIATLVLYVIMCITGFLIPTNWAFHIAGLTVAIIDLVKHQTSSNESISEY